MLDTPPNAQVMRAVLMSAHRGILLQNPMGSAPEDVDLSQVGRGCGIGAEAPMLITSDKQLRPLELQSIRA